MIQLTLNINQQTKKYNLKYTMFIFISRTVIYFVRHNEEINNVTRFHFVVSVFDDGSV
jgi:hypothetical protein